MGMDSIFAKQLIARWSEEYRERLVRHRRHFHRHPEVSYHEFETQKYILAALEKAGVSVRTVPGFACVIGHAAGKLPGKHLAFRGGARTESRERAYAAEADPSGAQHDR